MYIHVLSYMYVCMYDVLFTATLAPPNILLLCTAQITTHTYGATQLQFHFNMRLHAWYHDKTTYIHGIPSRVGVDYVYFLVAYDMHIWCNLPWKHS